MSHSFYYNLKYIGGLVYSHDLQTCDWPRNVACKTEPEKPPQTENQINTDTLEDLETPLILHAKKVSPVC